MRCDPGAISRPLQALARAPMANRDKGRAINRPLSVVASPIATPASEAKAKARVTWKAIMAAMNPLLTKVFRGPLDLNGPVIGRLFYLFEYARAYVEERHEAFDARFGTDTSSPVFEHHQKTSVHFYVPTTASVIYEIIGSLPLTPNKFTFIDMGSGKGRALLVASEFPFTKIVGVELSSYLHHVAEENIKRYKPSSQQCAAFELHCMDALGYAYGEEPFVLFLFDPFGREILEKIIANLEATLRARPREAYVVYVYPQYDDLFQNSSVLRRVREASPKWQPWNQYVVYAASAGTATSDQGAADAQLPATAASKAA